MPASPTRAGSSVPGSTDGVRVTLHDRDGHRRVTWREVGAMDWSKFGLVLGAGGATGFAFETGCLLALSTDHHIRLGDATMLVGTSAGSIAASLIALGFDGVDLAAVVAELDQYLDPALASMGVRFDDDMPPIPGIARMIRRPSIGSTATNMQLVVRRRFTALLANSLRTGQFDLTSRLRFLEGVDWPATEHDLRIAATQVTTGGRRVFSARSEVPLIDAVAASCAVPGIMRPVAIDGVDYIDGGLFSPTNADVMKDADRELIVVISPMSGGRSNSAIGRVSSAHARRRLGSEVNGLRRHHRVVVIEPAARLSSMVVDAALDVEHVTSIVTAAFLGSSKT